MKLIGAPSSPPFYGARAAAAMNLPAHGTSPGGASSRRGTADTRCYTPRAHMFLLGQTVGKYQILANLGSGGFGTVFLARDAWIDKKVAIKVPHRQTGDHEELLQEPRLLAALDHQNIVGILTAERVDGTFFIVMEYVKGESLEAVLDREKSLDVPRALNYAVQILKGVEHAHEAQILHRDLRPANVLISESGICKVADFGTSRFLERSHATTVRSEEHTSELQSPKDL